MRLVSIMILSFIAWTMVITQHTAGLNLTQPDLYNATFESFKLQYSKKYSSVAEEDYRRYIYMSNVKRLNLHNSNASRLFNMKANSFLDINQQEFKKMYTGTFQSNSQSRAVADSLIHSQDQNASADNNPTGEQASQPSDEMQTQNSSNNGPNLSVQDSHHFRSRRLDPLVTLNDSLSFGILEKTLVIPASNISKVALKGESSLAGVDVNLDWSLYAGTVRYQGLCGACYAFSTVDTLASLNAISQFGFFVPLSVQQIIDCVNNSLTFGCNGGFLEGAFTYMQMSGIQYQPNYPYTSQTTGKPSQCQSEGGPFRLTAFNPISEGDCMGVVSALEKGPVSAGIAGYNLQFYDSGIFNDCNDVLDHAIVIVGYRTGLGWRIKNSWGVDWGESGYGWIAEGNTCGICNMAVNVML